MGPPHLSGLGPHVSLPESIENMRKIALHLKSLVVHLSTRPKFEQTQEACIKLCLEMMKVVDLWTAIQRQDDWLTACFTFG
ncbi:unnamed protein product [Camellia sinensis]